MRCDRCLSWMTSVSSSTVVFAAPLFWNVQLIRVTVERNGQREGRRNRKTWYVLIYLCCSKVSLMDLGLMDLGLQSGVTISVNTVNNDYLFLIVTVNDYIRHGRTHSDQKDLLKRIMFRLFPQ